MSTEKRIPIEVRNLTFAYERDEKSGTETTTTAVPPALSGIDLTIESGTVVVLIGPSGSGKTTLCKCLTGIIPKLIKGNLDGEVLIFGREIAQDSSVEISMLSTQIGFVMQEPDHQIVMTTVEDDIAFGPENSMMPSPEIRALVDHLIADMGLEAKAETNPNNLSGGEKQRLTVAGVLAMEPEIMVFDEPVSSLDAVGKAHFVEIVKELKAAGKTIIIVEHDYEVFDFADRWILIKDGRVAADAIPSAIPKTLLERELWR
ncbi:MAG: energy-coupling factor ABC transporter ATP-binding protein [Clostridiales Family XIII bacterium]|jgi:energy-coupling factor transport system ATP-binding protein|nr:energy-coupling factor ABC transporter ATP-binding protein [Clostridiales Family XIII bacterium]